MGTRISDWTAILSSVAGGCSVTTIAAAARIDCDCPFKDNAGAGQHAWCGFALEVTRGVEAPAPIRALRVTVSSSSAMPPDGGVVRSSPRREARSARPGGNPASVNEPSAAVSAWNVHGPSVGHDCGDHSNLVLLNALPVAARQRPRTVLAGRSSSRLRAGVVKSTSAMAARLSVSRPPVASTAMPTARFDHYAVWTGTEMIVWGGETDGGTMLADGAAYNPATDSVVVA